MELDSKRLINSSINIFGDLDFLITLRNTSAAEDSFPEAESYSSKLLKNFLPSLDPSQ
jgi:hypothetical protein